MGQLLVATQNGLWSLPGPSRELAGHDVSMVVVDGDHHWAIVDGAVWRRTGGLVWEQVASVAPDRATALLPTDGGLLVGTSGAHAWLLHAADFDKLIGFEAIEGRTAWYTPWGAPPDIRSMTSAGDHWLVNVHVGGILRSDTSGAGAHWEQTIDIETDVHQVVADGDWIYAATGTAGLAFSTDGGTSWGFDKTGLHATYLRAVAVAGDTVLISVSRGPYGDGAAVYRRRLVSDAPFEKCTAGLPPFFFGNINTHCLHAVGSTVALGTPDGEVYVSEDEGETWHFKYGHLPKIRQVLVTAP